MSWRASVATRGHDRWTARRRAGGPRSRRRSCPRRVDTVARSKSSWWNLVGVEHVDPNEDRRRDGAQHDEGRTHERDHRELVARGTGPSRACMGERPVTFVAPSQRSVSRCLVTMGLEIRGQRHPGLPPAGWVGGDHPPPALGTLCDPGRTASREAVTIWSQAIARSIIRFRSGLAREILASNLPVTNASDFPVATLTPGPGGQVEPPAGRTRPRPRPRPAGRRPRSGGRRPRRLYSRGGDRLGRMMAELAGEVAGHLVPGADLHQRWFDPGADVLGHLAPGPEPASRGRGGRAGHVAGRARPLPGPPTAAWLRSGTAESSAWV